MTEKRDLKADLKSIQEGRTLFDDPDPSVGTKYELYEVAEQAIERAIEAEALVRELVDGLQALFYGNMRGGKWGKAHASLEKAKKELGDV